jgi:hypothetical protein
VIFVCVQESTKTCCFGSEIAENYLFVTCGRFRTCLTGAEARICSARSNFLPKTL